MSTNTKASATDVALGLTTIEGKVWTTSLAVAERFGKLHKDVLKSLRNLNCSLEFNQRNFAPVDYKDRKGEARLAYNISRDGFAILAMGFTGAEAMAWKEKYIQAFNSMEEHIQETAKTDTVEWVEARSLGKVARRSVTDTVQKFVDYAVAQGSNNSSRYYSLLTIMEYKALGLISKSDKVPKEFKDTLATTNLGFLASAESIAKQALEAGMAAEMYYKDIYQYASQSVVQFGNALKLPQLPTLKVN